MKLSTLLPVALLFFVACHQPAAKQEASTPIAKTVSVPFETIEDIARYVTSVPFDSIASDTMLNRKFEVNRTVVEDEGVDWDQYLFMEGQKLLFVAENNLEEKKKVSKVTFQDPGMLTQSGIAVGMPFSKIVQMMDSTKLNSTPGGYLVFHDKNDPHIRYSFELVEDAPMLSDINSLSEISPNMRISYIVWMAER